MLRLIFYFYLINKHKIVNNLTYKKEKYQKPKIINNLNYKNEKYKQPKIIYKFK